MVLKKRLDRRFHGFQVPTIPRGPRSTRRRGPIEKKSEGTQFCAFELLASLAGKLLRESESSSASSNASIKGEIKQEQLTKDECFGHGSSEESAFASEICSADIDQKFPNSASERTPSKFDFVQKSSADDVKSVIRDTKPTVQNYPTKAEKDCPITGASYNAHVGNGIGGFETGGRLEPASLTTAKLVDRDDDENFATFDKSSVNVKAFRPPTHVGDHRIRKLLTSKYWKTAPKLSDCEGFRSDRGRKTSYNKRKNSYQHDRCHYETLNKRRKLFDQSAVILSDGGFSSESATNSPEKPKKGDTCISNNGMFQGAPVVSPSIISRQSSFQSKDSHVKLSIKSFKIPELYIEVPETATVGLLKRTVMEAITAILGGEFCIGVHLEGENIRDDNITLSQTGLSCKDNLDTLGFTLEPNTNQISPITGSGEVCCPLPCVTPESSTRSPGTPGICDASPELSPPVGISANTVESSHALVSFDADSIPNNTTPNSRALVVEASPVSVAALAIVPVIPKSSRKCSDLIQRRTRRPFSVTEVEALVHAVEDLGTGRWRDVKFRAFEDADHRTYVDLKDKWKTLVHTATISPQQRRGEPVPQELLDRVLAAHSYWSQHQARQHGKSQGVATPAQIAGSESDNNTSS